MLFKIPAEAVPDAVTAVAMAAAEWRKISGETREIVQGK
jgi:hypothetical protein